MTQCTFNISPTLLQELDEAVNKREVSRSKFIADAIAFYFEPKPPASVEVDLLKKDIERLNELLIIREIELKEAKDRSGEYWLLWKEINDRLIQYQLPPTNPRRGFWSRFRRKKNNV